MHGAEPSFGRTCDLAKFHDERVISPWRFDLTVNETKSKYNRGALAFLLGS
jgi:hypothetical protein